MPRLGSRARVLPLRGRFRSKLEPDTLAAEFTQSFQQGRREGPLAAGSVCSRDPRVGGCVQGLPGFPHDEPGPGSKPALCPGESRAIHGYYATESQSVAIYQGLALQVKKAESSSKCVPEVLTRYRHKQLAHPCRCWHYSVSTQRMAQRWAGFRCSTLCVCTCLCGLLNSPL